MPVIEKTDLMRPGHLQRRHAFQQEIVIACMSACRPRDSGKRIRTTPAKEAGIAQRRVSHFHFPRGANEI
jgi:hypothetical protein